MRERQVDVHTVGMHPAVAVGELPEQQPEPLVEPRLLHDRHQRGEPARALAAHGRPARRRSPGTRPCASPTPGRAPPSAAGARRASSGRSAGWPGQPVLQGRSRSPIPSISPPKRPSTPTPRIRKPSSTSSPKPSPGKSAACPAPRAPPRRARSRPRSGDRALAAALRHGGGEIRIDVEHEDAVADVRVPEGHHMTKHHHLYARRKALAPCTTSCSFRRHIERAGRRGLRATPRTGRSYMIKQRLLATAGAAIAGLALAGPAPAATQTDTTPLREEVSAAGSREHHGGARGDREREPRSSGVPTRATGTPGHEASVDYVVEKMKAAGFNVTLQPFEADIFFEEARRVRAGHAEPDDLPALRRRGRRLVHRRLLRRRRRHGGGRRRSTSPSRPTRPAPRLRLRGRRTSRPRRHGQDRAAAARHLRLRPQGENSPASRRGRRGDLQRGHDRRGRPQRRAHPDARRLRRHDPGRRHRLRHRPRARRPVTAGTTVTLASRSTASSTQDVQTEQRDRRDARRAHRPHGRRRRPPRLGLRGSGHQRRRLRRELR